MQCGTNIYALINASRLAGYFPMRLVKTAELPPDRNYVAGVHPHGIVGFATYVTFCTQGTDFSALFPGIRRFPCTLMMQYWFPLRREALMLTGERGIA